MPHQFKQRVKINGDILQYVRNEPKKSRPPLILYEDGLGKAKGKLISKQGEFIVRDGEFFSPTNKTLQFIHPTKTRIGKSVENLALAHALYSLHLPDGKYCVQQLKSFTNPNANVALEKINQIKSIFIDTDGLDVTVLEESEIEYSFQGSKLAVTTQPIYLLLEKIRDHPTKFREREEPISISFINPNLEGLEYSGLRQEITEEQLAKFISENIGFSSLRINDPMGGDIDLVCSTDIIGTNPKRYFKKRFNEKAYNDFLRGLVPRFEQKMSINLVDILNKYFPQRNPTTQLHAYIKKERLPSEIQKMPWKEKRKWFAQRKRFFDKILSQNSVEKIVQNLMQPNYYTTFKLELQRIRGPGNLHKKKFYLSNEKKIPFDKSELEEIINKIFESLVDENPPNEGISDIQIDELKKNLRYKADGSLDMRFKACKEWVSLGLSKPS